MLRVLIVDADPGYRELLRQLLGNTVEVVEAAEAEDAVEKAVELRPQLVLLSLDVSGADEGSVAKRVKAARPSTKVILLTSHAEEAYLSSTGKSGADALLRKQDVARSLFSEMRRLAAPSWQAWSGIERRGQLLTSAKTWDGKERRARHRVPRAQ